jgi:hypothetical protein
MLTAEGERVNSAIACVDSLAELSKETSLESMRDQPQGRNSPSIAIISPG